ncbi:thiamine diphosphokinase [Sagittula stellata]|uniref:thiamine diphosphokinase n=1 Tax=Sagittula stellata TaxID=52603 RepID=UPI002FC33B60
MTVALASNSPVVAADGGAAQVLRLGHMPEAVFGDMDSLSGDIQARLAPGVLRPVPEQDSTDFDKCLRHIEAPLVLGYGFLGARLDHQLAAMNVLVRRPDRRCVLIGPEDVVCLCPPELTLDLGPGERVSLFPLAEARGQSEGLRWPLDGLRFFPGDAIGTSNEATGPVRLTFGTPSMLIILSVAHLNALVSGLEHAPRWPARA